MHNTPDQIARNIASCGVDHPTWVTNDGIRHSLLVQFCRGRPAATKAHNVKELERMGLSGYYRPQPTMDIPEMRA